MISCWAVSPQTFCCLIENHFLTGIGNNKCNINVDIESLFFNDSNAAFTLHLIEGYNVDDGGDDSTMKRFFLS